MDMTSSEDWDRVARAGAWFASLRAEFAAALLADARSLALVAGQRLFARGDPPDGLYCVLQGAVRINATTESGQEALLAMLEPPQWFGEIAVFDGAPRTHDAWAEGDCELLHVPQEALLETLARQPQEWRALGCLLTPKLRAMFMAVEELSLLPPTPRLAARLITIAGGYGTRAGEGKRVLDLSQEQLGLMLSVSRQTINQSLRELEARGAIRRSRGAIEILDLDGLRAARGKPG